LTHLGRDRFRRLGLPAVVVAALAAWPASGAFGFEGLNHYQQRCSRGGNQFSVEPPDQGLCVGNGDVVEVIVVLARVSSPA
jgi:hypothetical protein